MIPSGRLIGLIAALAVFALLLVWWPEMTSAWLSITGASAVVAAVDAGRAWRVPTLQAQRIVAPVLAVHRLTPVALRINGINRTLDCDVHDDFTGLPTRNQGLPARARWRPEQQLEVRYQLAADRRGWLDFGAIWLRLGSPFRLWWRMTRIACDNRVRVLPDFSMLAYRNGQLDARLRAAAGLRRQRQRGSGTEFHQLRDWQPGDALSRVEWKATSRHSRLIAREYERERGQDLVLMIDTSRRMRAVDEGLPHFDAALMSALRLAHTALERGDRVGAMTFGGADIWVKPQRFGATEAILNALFDVQPSLQPPDYLRAAQALMTKQRRRALVVIVTNLRDEDSDEFLPALTVLSRRHLVLVASLRESLLANTIERPVGDAETALDYVTTEHYLAARQKAHARIRAEFSHLLDVEPQHLAASMIDEYLTIKQIGAV